MIPQFLHGLTGSVNIIFTTAGNVPATAVRVGGFAVDSATNSIYVVPQ